MRIRVGQWYIKTKGLKIKWIIKVPKRPKIREIRP